MAGMSSLEVREALSGIVSAMEADSYLLEVTEVSAEQLRFSITAQDGACEDCLAPHAIMSGVISTTLGGRYRPEQIHIEYP